MTTTQDLCEITLGGDVLKPSYSLELSMSPSSTRDDFAACLVENDTIIPPSIEAAGQLVQKLLDQLSLNDSPPTNDDLLCSTSSNLPPSPADESSKQCHVQILSYLEGGTQTASTRSCDSIPFPHQRYTATSNLSRQGHVALANLCAHTLESIGHPNGSMVDDTIIVKRQCKESSAPPTDSSSIVPHSLSWIRKRWRKGSATSAGEFPKIKSFKSSEPPESENSVDHIPEPVRLQLFGSEYARFLSTTPLAPKDLSTRNFNKRNPLPPAFRRRTQNQVPNIEEAQQSALTGPITDVIVTYGDEQPPKGYYRISTTASGEPFHIRDRKNVVYLHVKKETNWDRAAQRPCVTALTVIFPERKEFVPPGFSVVRRHTLLPSSADRVPADLNLGGGEPAYLCFRRSREGNPITGIIPLLPSRRESIPEGYTVLERTPRNFVASLRSSNDPLFIAYRQRLANLELLRPLPLVKYVYSGAAKTKKLMAYYCTGGTVVESRVGRFHVMDRSTHSLLSPSSINNRLSLIEASRRKTIDSLQDDLHVAGERYTYSTTTLPRHPTSTEVLTSSLLLVHGLGTPSNRSVMTDCERQSCVGDFDSEASLSEQNRSSNHSKVSIGGEDIENMDTTAYFKSLCTDGNNDLSRCMKAMSFIPPISTGLHETDSKGMSVFQSRVSVLAPILTACYTKHGGSALIAVEGLTTLLQSDFFSADVNMSRDASTQTTLLDIAVQVVCDVATMGAQETHLYACVEFVELGVKYSCGYLSTRSVGYVMRFYLFVFYFGVSSPTGNWGVLRATDQYLLDDPRTSDRSILPGGAAQFAILAFKDLIVFLVARLGSMEHLDRCALTRQETRRSENSGPPHINSLIGGLVDDIVDHSVQRVDMANFTELALHQIMRSGGSELFWYEMVNSCGSGLFGNDKSLREETRHMYALCFAVLANCAKVAYSKVRRSNTSEGIPRDIAGKLMSLEMIRFFLQTWERGLDPLQTPGSTSDETFAFSIRRLVVPCLLTNTQEALNDPRVFRRLIQVVGALWCSPFFRKHMKVELGILFDHFVLGLLRLGPQILFKSSDDHDMTYLFAQQLELLKEIKTWFSGDADRLLELFLNFDTEFGSNDVGSAKELLSGFQWRICEQLCSSLCSLSEKCTEFLVDKVKESQSTYPLDNMMLKGDHSKNQGYEGVSTVTLARESSRRLRQGAIDAISQIVQLLAEAASLSAGPQISSIIDAWIRGEPIKRHHSYSNSPGADSMNQKYELAQTRDDADTPRAGTLSPSVVGYWHRLGAIKKRIAESKEPDSHREDSTSGETEIAPSPVYTDALSEKYSPERVNSLNVAFDIAKEKGLKKAVDYLIACNVLTASPRDIASFLRIHHGDFSPSDLGKYLGEGGSDRSETEYWNLIRFSYVRAISFVGMSVEEGLRHLLTQGGFRLPGEAQQIDRLISTFSQCYWEDNAGDSVHCPFEDQDTVFLLSFAIIMLNTDLHKSHDSNGNKKRQTKKMTQVEFINNLRGVAKGEDINVEYLAHTYDSIEAGPIVFRDDDDACDSVSLASEDLQTSIAGLVDRSKSVDALLRGLSIHECRFVSLQDYCGGDVSGVQKDAMGELAKMFLVKTWHQFHGLVNSALEVAHLDPELMESCIHLLKYALSLTIVLDMPIERVAYLDQLGRFRLFKAWRQGNSGELLSKDQECYKREAWYKTIQQQSRRSYTTYHSREAKLESLEILDEIVNDLGFDLASDMDARKCLRDAVGQLEGAEFLLNDPNRTFVRAGNLLKRANRSGRCLEYRFFLFSDILIYARRVPGGPSSSSSSSSSSPTPSLAKYRIHEELPLILMKVVDWFPPEMRKESKVGIQIYHPRKKVLVLCADHEERKSWVTDLRTSIDRELERKVAIEGARKAAANVPNEPAA